MHYLVGMRLAHASGHVVVEADDALAAALQAKADCPEATITYVRRRNRRGDRRHPPGGLRNEAQTTTHRPTPN